MAGSVSYGKEGCYHTGGGDNLLGYYMNKEHWNSVKTDGGVPDDLLKDMLDKSYALILSKLPKKKQKELLGE